MWHVWPYVTTSDKCDHMWQVWPHVTSVTTCDMCDHMRHVWPLWTYGHHGHLSIMGMWISWIFGSPPVLRKSRLNFYLVHNHRWPSINDITQFFYIFRPLPSFVMNSRNQSVVFVTHWVTPLPLHMGRGGTDRSKVGNSKKCYYPINFWILVVNEIYFLKFFPQPFLRYGNPTPLQKRTQVWLELLAKISTEYENIMLRLP